MKKQIILLSIAVVTLVVSCSKESLEPTLTSNKPYATAITSVEELQCVALGMYNRMTATSYYGRDFIIFGEVRTDNCFANGASGRFLTPAGLAMGITDAFATDTWTQIYRVIANANIIISKKDEVLTGDADLQAHLVGQAYAVRALAHYDLLTLYGQQNVTVAGANSNLGVPYITEFKGANAYPKRNTVAEVKAAIYADLTAAETYLDPNYDTDAHEITTIAVDAIRSRVALYFKDWTIARDASLNVINSGWFSMVDSAGYKKSFDTDLPTNAIFSLAFSATDNANINGLSNMYRGQSYGDVRVLANLYNIFAPGDVRGTGAGMIGMELFRANNTNYRTNFGKYPAADYSSDVTLFRLEEMVLNYAEALYEINNADPEALTQLNSIVALRGSTLVPYATCTKANILLERRKELCFEGFRFNDLARTGNDIPKVSTQQRFAATIVYGAYNYAFPIPKAEIDANLTMPQNFNY